MVRTAVNSDFVYLSDDEALGLMLCRQRAVGAMFTSARNCTPNEVLSSSTNMFKGDFERMTKETTVTAPSTIKVKVVAPPDGNIFTFGAKRFHCAEVLPTEVLAVPVALLIRRAVLKSQCKSVPKCVVATLMSLATAGRGPLPISSSLPRLAPRITFTGSWIILLVIHELFGFEQ